MSDWLISASRFFTAIGSLARRHPGWTALVLATELATVLMARFA